MLTYIALIVSFLLGIGGLLFKSKVDEKPGIFNRLTSIGFVISGLLILSLCIGIFSQMSMVSQSAHERDSIIQKTKNDSIIQENRFLKDTLLHAREIGMLKVETVNDSLKLLQDSIRFNLTLRSFSNIMNKQNKTIEDILRENYPSNISKIDFTIGISLNNQWAKNYYSRITADIMKQYQAEKRELVLHAASGSSDTFPAIHNSWTVWSSAPRDGDVDDLPAPRDAALVDFLSVIHFYVSFFSRDNKSRKIPDLELYGISRFPTFRYFYGLRETDEPKQLVLASPQNLLVNVQDLDMSIQHKSITFTSLLDFNHSYVEVSIDKKNQNLDPSIRSITLITGLARNIHIDSLKFSRQDNGHLVFSKQLNIVWDWH